MLESCSYLSFSMIIRRNFAQGFGPELTDCNPKMKHSNVAYIGNSWCRFGEMQLLLQNTESILREIGAKSGH